MKCEIKKIIRKDRNKEGKLYINKNGKPFTLISLQICGEEAEEMGMNNEWISGFANDYNAEWKDGDIIDIAITESKGKNGQLYKNFKNLVQRSSRLDRIEEDIRKIKEVVFSDTTSKSQGGTSSYSTETSSKPEDDISSEEVPF